MSGRKHVRWIAAGAALVVAVATGCLQVGSPTEVPVSAATGFDINDAGVVVGKHMALVSGNVVDRAFARDTVSGVTTELGTLGGGSSTALGINDDGVVVGQANTATAQHAFRWTSGGGMVDLGTLDAPATTGTSSASAINSSGVIVGTSTSSAAGGKDRAFVRDPATGVMTSLGTLGGSRSGATAINDGGVIVGWSEVPGDTEVHAFVVPVGGSMIDIGTLGGTTSQAEDVNTAGIVVGWSTTGGNSCEELGFECDQYRAFTYDVATGIRTQLATIAGTTDAFASGINDDGVVVGSVRTVEFVCSHCSYPADGVAWELGTTGLYQVTTDELSGVQAINDAGLAVGNSNHFSGGSFPIPVPYTFTVPIDKV